METLDFSLISAEIQCPYCWETFEIVVDPSIEQQIYTEDCFVCCRPIELHVSTTATGEVLIEAIREND